MFFCFLFQEREPPKPGQTQLCSLHFKALKKKKKNPYFGDLQKFPVSSKITSLKKLNKQWTSKNKTEKHIQGFLVYRKILYFKYHQKWTHRNSNDKALPLVCEVLPSEEPGCISFPACSYTIQENKKKAAKSNTVYVVTFLHQALLKPIR